MTIDLEKLRPIFEDALSTSAAKAAEKHKVPKTYVQSLLSLARHLGAAPAAVRGATRKYDPAAVVAALIAKPIGEVAEQFGLSTATLLKIDAEARKTTKSASGAGEPAVQQQAA